MIEAYRAQQIRSYTPWASFRRAPQVPEVAPQEEEDPWHGLPDSAPQVPKAIAPKAP